MNALVATVLDRANPVLVKEVRAALRGRYFRVSFAIVLALATIASLLVLAIGSAQETGPSGMIYFTVLSGCASVGVNLLVPFSAMLSMTSEQDEHTLELLQLSGLRGWTVVLGKLQSALIQGTMILSAFVPFLTLAFLMEGVGIELVVSTVAFSLAACALQSSLGILLGTLARARWARVVLLVVFGMVLFQTSQIGAVVFISMFAGMSAFGSATAQVIPIGVLLAFLTITVAFLAMASGRLAHREENHSTPVRVAVTGILLFAMIAAAWSGTFSEAMRILSLAYVFVLIPMAFLATERETLPRAVSAHLPRWALRVPLASAWLPGGARGATFVTLHVGALFACAVVFHALLPSSAQELGEFAFKLAAGLGFLLLVPGLLFAWNTNENRRALVRGAVVGFFGAANLSVLVVGALLQETQLFEYVPVAIPYQVDASGWPVPIGKGIGLLAFAAVAVLVNVPRILRARDELSAARRRARDAAQGEARAATES